MDPQSVASPFGGLRVPTLSHEDWLKQPQTQLTIAQLTHKIGADVKTAGIRALEGNTTAAINHILSAGIAQALKENIEKTQ